MPPADQPVPDRSALRRLRDRFGDRALGMALALAVEGLVVLLLLTLGPRPPRFASPPELAVFDATDVPAAEPIPAEAEAEPEEQPQEEPDARPAPEPPPQVDSTPMERQTPDVPATPPVVTPPPPAPQSPWMAMTREQMAQADIARLRRPAPPAGAPRRERAGPPDTGRPGPPDSQRVEGTGPNGEPLYAAEWYRRPLDIELRGYLSTASGPGWGLIACRTVAQFRVEDCIPLGESPQGSNIARAVLAAAWQFRVRPPRVGGRTMVGEWVRIRIDYGIDLDSN